MCTWEDRREEAGSELSIAIGCILVTNSEVYWVVSRELTSDYIVKQAVSEQSSAIGSIFEGYAQESTSKCA
jgi:hypothetical protein